MELVRNTSHTTTRQASPTDYHAFGSVQPKNDIKSCREYLSICSRALIILGAGLSASSGIPTFQGAGGLWRQHDVKKLSSPYTFREDPKLVWEFYRQREQQAVNSRPNAGHYALARLASRHQGFLTMSQNIDGLSERAAHPAEHYCQLHGSLSIRRCTVCHATTPSPTAPEEDEPLPHCQQCGGLLRPNVLWFSEKYSDGMLAGIDRWLDEGPVQLVLVVGTSLGTSLVAECIDRAMDLGARVAVVNTNEEDVPDGLDDRDWFFNQDAAAILPWLVG